MVLCFATVVGDFCIFFKSVKQESEDLTAAKVDCDAHEDNSKNVKYLSFLKP